MNNLDKVLTAVYQKDVPSLEGLSSDELRLVDDDGRTPLIHAVLAENSDPAVVKLLAERGLNLNTADKGQKWTALHFAARDQKEDIVKILLEHGASVDAVDAFGNTPLMQAVSSSSPNLRVVKELLKYKADAGRANNYGVTPLELARNSGHLDLLSVLKS